PDDYNPNLTGWTLSWADEFNNGDFETNPDYAGDTWDRLGRSAGNGEFQVYTEEEANSTEEDGYMVIKAEWTGNYTSARVISNPGGSRGDDPAETGKAFKYGKIAARIQLPYGKAIWPAFWMLGTNISETGGDTPWPSCGEIDIAETGSIYSNDGEYGHRTTGHVLHFDGDVENIDRDHQFWHTAVTAPSGELWGDQFHVFEIEWDESNIVFKIDDVVTSTKPITAENMTEFHEYFYVIFNIAVGGGDFTYDPDGTAIFPQYMFVDWIRYYEATTP
ncbi:MAG: glycoside hydrolase family 16 protein, partial [Spirochaetaceae bacterium]|nr:glycoside hydrolase family 16 protein [Spirochaetaceae bacterium]